MHIFDNLNKEEHFLLISSLLFQVSMVDSPSINSSMFILSVLGDLTTSVLCLN